MKSLMRCILVLVIPVFVAGCAAKKQALPPSPNIEAKVAIDYDLLADKIVERLQKMPLAEQLLEEPKELAEMITKITNPFNGHRYALINKKMTWREAKAHAERLGGYLATITSQEEQDWICQTFTNAQFWLGGTDEALEGDWQWVTGERWDYTNWAPGEPNNVVSYYEGGENAIVMRTLPDNPYGLWNDWPTDSLDFFSSLLLEFDSRTAPK